MVRNKVPPAPLAPPGGTVHPYRRPRPLACAATLGLLLAACAGAEAPQAGDDGSGPPGGTEEPAASDGSAGADDGPTQSPGSAAAVLEVVATVAPVADLVRAVGGDRVEVGSLVPPGADSHTYEPRPSDVAALEEADLYVGIGLSLNDAALTLAEATVGEGAQVVRLGEEALDDDALVFDHDHHHGDGDHGHSHGDGDGDEHGHSHADDGGPGPNPHVWTSIRNAAELVDHVAALLGDLDPDGADGYQDRADAYLVELEALDEATATAVATIPVEDRTLVTFHDAWTYFARDHDLEFATAVQPADFTEPSASEVRAVIDLVRELQVPAVFGSEVFPSRVLEAIAAETDAVYIGDLADDVLPGQPGDPEHSYLGMMRRNATTIVEGLGGEASALR